MLTASPSGRRRSTRAARGVRRPAARLRRVVRRSGRRARRRRPAEEAWTWSDDHTVGFILRRQAHEALVHRVDAEQAAGASRELDAELAADGVAEVPRRDVRRLPAVGLLGAAPRRYVRVDVHRHRRRPSGLQFGPFSGTDPDSGRSYADEEDFHVVDAPDDRASRRRGRRPGGRARPLAVAPRRTTRSSSVAGDRACSQRFTRDRGARRSTEDRRDDGGLRSHGLRRTRPAGQSALDGAGALGCERDGGVAGRRGLALLEGAVGRAEAQRVGRATSCPRRPGRRCRRRRAGSTPAARPAPSRSAASTSAAGTAASTTSATSSLATG